MIAGLYGKTCIFSFVKNCQSFSQIDCTILYYHQQWIKVPVATYHCQNLLFFFCFLRYAICFLFLEIFSMMCASLELSCWGANLSCFLNLCFGVFHQFWESISHYLFKYCFYPALSFNQRGRTTRRYMYTHTHTHRCTQTGLLLGFEIAWWNCLNQLNRGSCFFCSGHCSLKSVG